MFVKKSMEELGRADAETMKTTAKHPVIVILDDVRSMHNVGSAFRTCDGFAAAGLYLCGYTPTPPHRDIHKTALGATDTVSWKHFATTMEAVHAAKDAGYKIYAAEQVHNSTMLQQFNWDKETPIALVFGNEVSGVNEEILAMADGVIEIPQWGAKHSFNISVSIGIVLWEFMR